MAGRWILIGLAIVTTACSSLQVERYQGQASNHFDGNKFRNTDFFEAIESRSKKSKTLKDVKYVKVGHSTVLIQVDGMSILTDPIWSDRCGPFSWAGPRRIKPPAIKFQELPKIDLVLVSHNHYDHLDIPTLRNLSETFQPLIVVGLGNRTYLEDQGITNVVELDWWQEVRIKSGAVHFVPAQHLSGRGFTDNERALWGGFVIETRSGPIYFAGDTGYGKIFSAIKKRFGAPLISFLPIGDYHIRKNFHLNPKQAIEAHLDLGSEFFEGIHYGTFSSDDSDKPLEELKRILSQRSLGAEQQLLGAEFGQVVTLKNSYQDQLLVQILPSNHEQGE